MKNRNKRYMSVTIIGERLEIMYISFPNSITFHVDDERGDMQLYKLIF